MKIKALALLFSLLLIFSFNLLLTQEPNEIVKTGNVDVYLGIFNLQSPSLDYYIRVPNATVKLINTETKTVICSYLTDQNGYVHLNEVLPGKYFIGVETKEGEYFFNDGLLVVKAVDYSKVYLHLEREINLRNLKEEVEGMEIMSQFPNLVGKIVEVADSPSVLIKNKLEKEQKKNIKPKKEKKKNGEFASIS